MLSGHRSDGHNVGIIMNNTGDRIMENVRWTAYMKLKGRAWARKEEEILDEFDGFVQSLRGVGVDYNIIVMVEGRAPRQLHSGYTKEVEPRIGREGGA
jgi:hypothetical protein